MTNRIIAVTGATGQQGGAVARELLRRGWGVRALTRDAAKPAARALASAGAQLVSGDMDNPAELAAAFDGAYGVFSVQNFWLPGVGAEGEVRQGKNVAQAAKATGVAHLVYSSVGGADRAPGVSHFESKWEIEQYIRALDLPATILRPVAFMENYFWSRDQILGGEFVGFGLLPETKLQLIAVDDIAAFAALAFAEPETYIGRTLEIAGDDLTEVEIAADFSRALGRPVNKIVPQPAEGQAPDEEMQRMWAWFTYQGYQADIPALRQAHPGLIDFPTWLQRTGWSN